MSDKKLIKILLAEDELSLLEPYAEYFRMQGYKVKTATNGEDALKIAKEFDYDIFLLDIMMPKMDGLEVLKQIKADPKLKDKKVLLLTALGRDSVIKEGFELGADGYLIKDSETPDTVEQNVRKTLGL
jgi:DNA-binding response OmpR family regulator